MRKKLHEVIRDLGKAKKVEENPVEETKIELYPKADYDFIKMISKVTHPTQAQMDEILRLYRKYIMWVYGYSTNCNCSTSISHLWGKLIGWAEKNKEKFEH